MLPSAGGRGHPIWLPAFTVPCPFTSLPALPPCLPALQDGLRLTYTWIKGELEKESKEGGNIRWGGGLRGFRGLRCSDVLSGPTQEDWHCVLIVGAKESDCRPACPAALLPLVVRCNC